MPTPSNPSGKPRRCSFCGQPATFTDRVGQCTLSVCDENDCNIQFDDESRETARDIDAFAREEAERDDYSRYKPW